MNRKGQVRTAWLVGGGVGRKPPSSKTVVPQARTHINSMQEDSLTRKVTLKVCFIPRFAILLRDKHAMRTLLKLHESDTARRFFFFLGGGGGGESEFLRCVFILGPPPPHPLPLLCVWPDRHTENKLHGNHIKRLPRDKHYRDQVCIYRSVCERVSEQERERERGGCRET